MTCQQNPDIPRDASKTSVKARNMPEKLGANGAQEIAWTFQSPSEATVTINLAGGKARHKEHSHS